jgi:polyhydroxyalkanoate synthase subunit PhaE
VENPSNYFDGWMKAQQQTFTALRDQASQMQSLFQNANPASDNPFAAWTKAAFQAFPIGADANLAKDTFSKSINGNEAMQKLFEMWQPLLNAIRDKTIDPSSYSDLTDPEKQKQLFYKLFNFDLDAISQLEKQTSHFADVYQQFGQSFSDASSVNPMNFMHGDFAKNGMQPDALLQQMKSIFSQFEESSGKMLSIPALGKDREKMEQMSACAKAMSNFSSKNIEYHQMMLRTGDVAMKSVVKSLADKVKAGEKFEKFDDFFSLWIDINEKEFNTLFFTQEFSDKRNAMSKAGFAARKLYNEIVENQLGDLPIARRSEMDEVYKLVYDLRKQVKSMQKQIQELKTQH